MDLKNETRQMLLKSVKCNPYPKERQGGQQVGVTTGIELESEELGIKIVVDNYISQYKNRQLAFALMELALDEVSK